MADRDRTHDADVGGGAFFGKPQERKFDGKVQGKEVFGQPSVNIEHQTA
jgi:hypothetical protein